jgi:hypothetical protein
MVTRGIVSHFSDSHEVPGLIEWEGRRDNSVVPEWLNAVSGTDSHVRVMKLIEEIHQVESGFDKAMRAGWYVPTKARPHPKAVREELEELARRHDRINEILGNYHFSPAILRQLFDWRWVLCMFSEPVEGECVYQKFNCSNKKSQLEYRIGEADIVLRVLNLAAASELERVQQCRRCSKWFYAERSHQKFCSANCRLDNYSKSPKHKKYRREYMRRRRAIDPTPKSAGRTSRKGR